MSEYNTAVHKELRVYWNNLPKNAATPWRSDVLPAHIQPILPFVFIAEFCPQNGAKFRLLGGKINAVFNMEMRAAPVLKIAANAAQEKLQLLLHSFFEGQVLLEVDLQAIMIRPA